MRLLLLCALTLLASCAQQVRHWKADDIVGIGAATVTLHHEGGTVGNVSSERVRRVIAVKDRIAKVTGQQVQLVISEGTEPNASAGLVNGVATVAINLAMLELLGDDDDAYATIIGHEFAHLTMNHAGRRQERETARQGYAHILGFVLGFAGVPMGGAIADVTTIAVATVYSRDEEREADRIGFDYMRKAGFDPRGAARVWQRLSTQGGYSIPFLSSHPSSDERMEAMKRMAQ